MYSIETEVEDDGRWIAEITNLPGVLAYGATEEEAIANAKAVARMTSLTELLDGLMSLPRSPVKDYLKGQAIYTAGPGGLYLVTSGLVFVSRVGANGKQIGLHVTPEWFGESSLLSSAQTLSLATEKAEALQPTSVMYWPAFEVKQARLASRDIDAGLMALYALRNLEYCERLEMMQLLCEQRTQKVLLQLAASIGTEQPGGATVLPALAHPVIAALTATTRERITTAMADLQRKGLITYNRHEITVRTQELRAA